MEICDRETAIGRRLIIIMTTVWYHQHKKYVFIESLNITL